MLSFFSRSVMVTGLGLLLPLSAHAKGLQTPTEREMSLDSAPITSLAQPAPAGWSSFAEEHYGYRLNYPSDWQRGTPQAYGLSLTPPLTQSSTLTSVLVLNLPFPTVGNKPLTSEQAVKAVTERYLNELKNQGSGAQVLRDVPFRWDTDSAIVLGRQVVSDFKKDQLPFRQWSVFMPSPYAPVLHLWQYTAPQSLFEDTLPTAQQILNSLKPAPVNSSAPAASGAKKPR